jgi:bifunctional DNA-binding transcriptional regulator/antitoxin component of YhaV-PrlF toxin-antitoxin module
MKLRMDKSGRVVFPKPLRRRLGLAFDIEFEAVEQPGGVLLRVATEQPSMIKIDGLWVHCGAADPGANWERALDEIRDERIQAVLKS